MTALQIAPTADDPKGRLAHHHARCDPRRGGRQVEASIFALERRNSALRACARSAIFHLGRLRLPLTLAVLALPNAAFAAAPIYFDLGGLVISALALLIGLVLLAVSAASRNRGLLIFGLALLAVPVWVLVLSPWLERQSKEAQWAAMDRNEKLHEEHFAKFCANAPRTPKILPGPPPDGRKTALSVKCVDEQAIKLCYALDERLHRRFERDGEACKTTPVGAVYREFHDGSPDRMKPAIIVPVCGEQSREPVAYNTHQLSQRVLRSHLQHGQGPMSHEYYFELELTASDAATGSPLATAIFYRSRGTTMMDVRGQSVCPTFESAVVEIEKALLGRGW